MAASYCWEIFKAHMFWFVTQAITSQPNTVGQLLNISETDHLKCLIIIGTDPYKESKTVDAICSFIGNRWAHCRKEMFSSTKQHPFTSSDPNVAIGGGFVEAIVHPEIPDRQRHIGIMGLAFCGASIKASSIVIPQEVTNSEDVEKIIAQVNPRVFSDAHYLLS